MIIGVGMNNSLWQRRNAARWRQLAHQLPGEFVVVAGTTTTPDGTLVAVGATDHKMYYRITLDAAWTQVPDSASVMDVTVLDDGRLVGAGMDGLLYTRASLLDASWIKDSPAGDVPVRAVATATDGGLLGVGRDDKKIYTKFGLADRWVLLPGIKGQTNSVAQLRDGTIIGTQTESPWNLQTWNSVVKQWKVLDGSGAAHAVSVRPDGALVGVGGDFLLYTVPELIGWWQPVGPEEDLPMMALDVLPDGRLLGVDTECGLYTLELATQDAHWKPVRNGKSVKSVAALPDGRVLGVGLTGKLQLKENLDAHWIGLASTRDVLAVAALPGGAYLGVGTDHQLLYRPELGVDWVTMPQDPVKVWSVAALQNGTILGVGVNGSQLYARDGLYSPWQAVPDPWPMLDVAEKPDPETSPKNWFLQYTSDDFGSAAGDGRPWGDGTAVAGRAKIQGVPWDTGCAVTPMVGGDLAMQAIRESCEAAIEEARRLARDGVRPGERGYVNIVDWLFDPLRSLAASGLPWSPGSTVKRDQTALGLVLRMMSEGIVVRLMLWLPDSTQSFKMPWNFNEHWNAAAAVQDHNAALRRLFNDPKTQFGTVLLDTRTAGRLTASLHQKMFTVRVGQVNVGFCGGVDLAFTRRDYGRGPMQQTGTGDWQSGSTAPVDTAGWPKQVPPPPGGYPAYPYTTSGPYQEELPPNVYGAGYRYWHDQHLKLEGPIVATLDAQFAERWQMKGEINTFDWRFYQYYTREWNGALLTNDEAIDGKNVVPLPAPVPAPRVGDAAVQLWRTIPLRKNMEIGPFARGEFTVMAGIANAIMEATQLITIWDQYFWSVPTAKLLAQQLRVVPTLRVLIVLPPFGTTDPANELGSRARALRAFWDELEDEEPRSRVLVRDAWAPARNVGIYVHAKVQTYDEQLLVAGSANLNRRSMECDAELDVAVLHRDTVRYHLGQLYAWIFGDAWSDYSTGWLERYWSEISKAGAKTTLVPDPFFVDKVVDPETPNHVPMPYNGRMPDSLWDPSSISSMVGLWSNVCKYTRDGDPKAVGRLDEITYLLERCHVDDHWPFRVAGGTPGPHPEPPEVGEQGEPTPTHSGSV